MYGGELDDVMAKQEYKERDMDDQSSSDSGSSRNSPGVDLNEASNMKQEFNPPQAQQQNSFASGGGGGDNTPGQDQAAGPSMRPNPITYATDKKRVFPVSGGMTPHQQQMSRLRDNYHGAAKPTFYDKHNQPGNRAEGGPGGRPAGQGGYQGNNFNPNYRQNGFQGGPGGAQGGSGGAPSGGMTHQGGNSYQTSGFKHNNRNFQHNPNYQNTRKDYDPRGENETAPGSKRPFPNSDRPPMVYKPSIILDPNEETRDVPVSKEQVALDSYSADLNIHVRSPDALGAKPCTHDVSGWIFGNVRATHGIRLPIEGPPSHIKTSSNAASSSRRVKCGFEIKIEECMEFDRDIIPRPEHRDAHFIRVGWSEANCQGNLGEERDSIGLDSLGRVLAEGQCFRHEYSKTCSDLSEGDVIGCFIEFDPNEEQAHFSFRVNEKNLGVLAKIPAKPEQSIFVPHILTRNIKFSCNFGMLGTYKEAPAPKITKKEAKGSGSESDSESEAEEEKEVEPTLEEKLEKSASFLPESKAYIRTLPAVPAIDANEDDTLDFGDENKNDADKDKGDDKDTKKNRYAPLIGDDFHLSRTVRCAGCVFRESPTQRSECEVIMCMGLPGSGKTTWTRKMTSTEEGKHKRYTTIGTEQILTRMAILGKPRNFKAGSSFNRGRMEPDPLQVPLSHIQGKWLELSHKRNRNYILDQLNVFPGSHVKKMRRYEGFQRSAAVIMPDDEEYKKRIRKREKDTGTDIPRRSIMELKNGISLPKVGGEYNGQTMFDKVIWSDLEFDECNAIVENYREEAKDYTPENKKFKGYLNNNQGYRGRDQVDQRYMNKVRHEERAAPPPRSSGAAPSHAPSAMPGMPAAMPGMPGAAATANPFGAAAVNTSAMTPEQQQQWQTYYQQVYAQYYQQYAALYGAAASGQPGAAAPGQPGFPPQ
jgi:hypothetical protein